MNIDVDYENIDGYAAAMKQIATEIDQIKNNLNYQYYGNIKTEGQFANAFAQMKSTVNEILSDIADFINGYSEIVSGVARNLEILDGEVNQLICSVEIFNIFQSVGFNKEK